MPCKSTAPRVSCVMPMRNAEAFLEAAVKSILSQEFSDFEFIIIDDGSSDNSIAIAQKLMETDTRVRLFLRPHRGIVATLNEGIALSRGEYFARMDADDVSLPARFGEQAQYLDENPNVVIAGTAARTIYADESLGPHISGISHLKTRLDRFPPSVSALLHPTIMVRTQVLKQAGGYRIGFRHAEDYELWMRLSKYGQFHVLPQPLLHYRVHNSSVSVSRMKLQEWSAVKAELDHVQTSGQFVGRVSRQTILSYWMLRVAKRSLVHNVKASLRTYFRGLKHLVSGVTATDLWTTSNLSMRYVKLALSLFPAYLKNRVSVLTNGG